MIDGRCLCGAVRVRAEPADPHLHACHCGMCRRWTGLAFAAFPAAPGTVEATGPIRTRAFSDWAERAWCDECGSALWYEVTAEGPIKGTRHVAAGLFDDAGGLSLGSEIYIDIDRKSSGYAFAGEHPVKTQAEIEALFALPPRGGRVAMTEGRCLCGAVRITVPALEAGASACHCSICRRWTGAAMWGFVAVANKVDVRGEVARYRSSAFAERAWCPACGTHLWVRDDGADYEFTPGLFDDAAEMPLVREVYADRALACVPLAGDHVRVSRAEYERDNLFVEGDAP